MTIQRYDVGPRMSRAATHNGTVYLSGLTADDLSEGIAGQTRQTLDKVDGYLAEAGTDKSRILRVEIWLAHISTYDAMNEVYDAWVDKQNPPVRACVEARLAGEGYLVEIMVTAAL